MRSIALGLSIAFAMAGCSSPEIVSLGKKRDKPSVNKPHGMDGGLDGAVRLDSGLDGAFDDSGTIDAGLIEGDPRTCAEAMLTQGYLGCEFWPTQIANATLEIFDFAIVIVNPGEAPTSVTVTGPFGTDEERLIQPGAMTKVYLPWVPELKGNQIDLVTMDSAPLALEGSVRKTAGAYRVLSGVPVLVFQFSPLQWKGEGGAPGKDWSDCPSAADKPGCLSQSNDASLLLPVTALTGNYRVATIQGGDPLILPLKGHDGVQGLFAITATQDDTRVLIKVSDTGAILGGTGVSATGAGEVLTLQMNAGDVAQLVGPNQTGSDLTGSQVQADKPVQVIAGSPCAFNSLNRSGCDHLEEIVMPAETLGTAYAVTVPTTPNAQMLGSIRLVGNVDGTELTFVPNVLAAPTTLNAGQVVALEQILDDFLVTGSHEFSVSTVQHAMDEVDQQMKRGDPSLSAVTALEQYRTSYVFPVPNGWEVSFLEVVAKADASLLLDSAPVTQNPRPIASTDYVVYRIRIDPGGPELHKLESDQGIGLQVIGYGQYASYQFPGGLSLQRNAAPPPPIME